MTPGTLRPLRWPADRAALLALDTAFTTTTIYTLEQGALGCALVETAVPPLHKRFPLDDELDDAPWDFALVAEAEGMVVGFVAVQLQRWNRRAVLLHLYVAPRMRGHGLGRELLTRAADYAAGAGARCLWLEVTNINAPAIGFYRRAGFQWCGFDTTLYDPAGPAGDEIALFFARDLVPAP